MYASNPNTPDFMVRSGKTYRILTDQVGSPRLVVNVANATDKPFSAIYTAFGESTITGIADFLPFGFAGGMYDISTGLVRFGARDYDPSVGRWTAKDPIRFDGKQANLYVYVNNDPVNRIDPFGSSCLGAGAAYTGAAIAAAAACGSAAAQGGLDPINDALCGAAILGLVGAGDAMNDACNPPYTPPPPPRCP